MRRFLFILLGIVVVLVIAVAAIVPLINWNFLADNIADSVRDSTGRELAVDGPIRVSLFPAVSVELSDVSLSNPDWAEAPAMMTLGAASLRMKTWPLISGRLEIDYVIVQQPVLNLEVDGNGRPSWELAGKPAEDGDQDPAPDDGDGDGGLPDLSLAEARIIGGQVHYIDRVSGQQVTIEEADINATAPALDEPVGVNGSLQLNGEPVSLSLSVDTPAKAAAGDPFVAMVEIDAAPLAASYSGRIQTAPVPGLDGSLDLQAPSVGGMMAWLGRPLPADQPDPGPVHLVGRFNAQGSGAIIESLTVTGDQLDLRISGGIDQVDGKTLVDLVVDGGVIDLDRYMPPPAQSPATPGDRTEAAPPAQDRGREGINPLDSVFAALPDQPVDLAPLRQLGAQILINLGGLKAQGYQIGPLSLRAIAEDGVATLDISQLSLYGGNITSTMRAEAAESDLIVTAATTVDQVTIDALVLAATGAAKARGQVSGTLSVSMRGASPKSLVESVRGELSVDLGGLDVEQARQAGLSGLTLTLDLPGIEAAPKLNARAVYNGEAVTVDLNVDPLPVVLSNDRFTVAAQVNSDPVAFSYDGAIQKAPIAGLDGDLTLTVPSVSALAAWLGQPLPENQPDPGGLQLAATLAADAGAVALKALTLTGDHIQATATGSLARTGEQMTVNFDLETGMLDIDRYLPAPTDAATDAPSDAPADVTPGAQAAPSSEPARGGRPAPADLLAALPDTPIDLSVLRNTDADLRIRIGGLKASGFEIGPMTVTGALSDGVLKAGLSQLSLYDGTIGAAIEADGSGDALGVDATITVDRVAVTPLAQAAGATVPVSGNADAALRLAMVGASPRALAESAQGQLTLTLAPDSGTGAAAGLTAASVTADLPGLEGTPIVEASATYNGEAVDLRLALAPLAKVMAGETFPLEASLRSAPITAGYEGSVQQQPVPGLDGAFDLAVPSVAALAAWAGSPLPADQPDPGPLNITAKLVADGPEIALTDATLSGKALDATANARFDSSATPPAFDAEVRVAALDLNAYLPPPAPQEDTAGGAGAPGGGTAEAQTWSDAPIDFSALSSASGDFLVALAGVRYRELTIDRGQINGALRNGVLTISVDDLGLADGTVTADASVDAAGGDGAAVRYQVAINGVQVEPILVSFADNDRLSGALQVQANGSTRGTSQKALVQALNGDGAIRLFDGAVKGINIAQTLRQVGSLGFGQSDDRRTDFSELGGTYVITNGVIDNRDFKMLAPLVRVDGAGTVSLPPRTVDYRVTAKLVASLEGQGGNQALAGLPIPILVRGPWHAVDPEIQWEGVLQDALADPERLKNMPADMLKAATGLGVDLPVDALREGGDVGGLLQEILPGAGGGGEDGGGGEGPAGDLGGVLDVLKQAVPGAGDSSSAPAPTQEAPQQAPQEQERGGSPLDAIEGLLNR